ncbi:YecR family lipoprotein [Geobacter sp. AOG2]|uniref:YecR family lipoprotein n=1 Tax=Geobacter sp. AOG2 TaxID=1566347 RepID=UPI0035A6EEA3
MKRAVMVKSLSALVIMVAALTSACTTTETMSWVCVGGSKADGNVILGIDVPPKFGIRETLVQWDPQQANTEANKRCQNWGYGSAEAFRDPFPVQVVCHQPGISPCGSKTLRIMYQCIGNLHEMTLTPVSSK